MIPTSSSSDSNGCNNISSNCVIWQGPDISCIDLCNGDTVSEVVAALATKLCEITDGVSNEPDLTGFDLKCALPSGATPTTLVENLQAIVTYICSLPTSSGTPYSEPSISLCSALQYVDESGNNITSLPLNQYAKHVGDRVCSILATITTIQNDITALGNRITNIENTMITSVNETEIIPTCVTSTVGALTKVSTVVSALEVAFCDLRGATGTVANITSTVQQQAIANGFALLSNSSSTYSAQTGWNSNSVNLANSVQNAWIVIKDIYDAVQTIQTNCCPGACDSLTFTFSVARQTASDGLTNDIRLDFAGSSLPAGYTDVGGTTLVTLTDAAGNTIQQNISISNAINSSVIENVDVVSGSGTFNEQSAITVSIDSSFTDGTNTCNTLMSQVAPESLPCPTDIAMTNITATGLTVGFTNILGTAAIYRIKLRVTGTTTVVADSGNLTNQGTSVSHAFTGLTANTNYSATVTVTHQGITKDCTLNGANPVTGATSNASANCNQGIDVAFAVDFTMSMQGAIETVKSGISSIIGTIKTQANHPTNIYRLALATFDETSGTSSTPTYNSASGYTGLPTAQKQQVPGVSTTMHFTTLEDFADNNETAFTTQLNLLNTTAFPMGSGNNTHEPGGQLISRIVSGNFAGAFRSGIARYVIVFTDQGPSGDDDTLSQADINYFNTLTVTCQNAGVKVIVLGGGVNKQFNGVYPYRKIATDTGGVYNATLSTATISAAIQNACGNTPAP